MEPAITPPARPQQAPIPQRTAEESSAQRLKTACSHCRQQKIKCRAADDASAPCERCAKMKLTCTYEPRHSRGRPRSESETFINETPKRRLVAKNEDVLPGYRPFVAINSAYGNGPTPPARSNPSPTYAAPSARPFTPAAVSGSSTTGSDLQVISTAGIAATTGVVQRKSSYISPAQTLPRSIDGLHVDAETIDNLFEQFFRYYHPFLPLLDANLRPDDYHAQSSFLFWSILAVASRRWPKDPTLMRTLRLRVHSHAMTTIFAPTVGTSSITAMLLLLNWSSPETQNHDEMPYVFSSALVHAAMRIGMNNPDCAQDFSRVKLSLTDAECEKRYQIFAQCLVLYQRSSCCMGNAFGNIPTYFSQDAQRYVAALPASLYLQMDLADILVRATMAIANNGLDLSNPAQRSGFDTVLQNYQGELDMAETRQSGQMPPLERLYLTISRLMLAVFHFYKVPASQHFDDHMSAYNLSCTLIRQINDLEKAMHIDLYGTFYIYYGALLAACILLRCLKSPFADHAGESTSTAQALFFSAINLMRNISISENDKPAKSAMVLQHLWRSDTVFKHADGTWNLDLRVRSRFSSSVLYDTMWWGREELFGQPNTYPKKSAPPLTPAWTNGEQSLESNITFAADAFTDMALTQDWILNEWEMIPSPPAPVMISNPSPQGVETMDGHAGR